MTMLITAQSYARKTFIVSVLALAVCAALSPGHITAAGELPTELTYNIYVYGELAGTSAMRITEKGGIIVFESTSTLEFDDYSHELTCKSEFDAESRGGRFFEYEGERLGKMVSGTLWVKGDSVVGDIAIDGNHFPSAIKTPSPPVLFENYVVEHQVMLFNLLARQTLPAMRFYIFFPSDFTGGTTIGMVESEIELPTSPKPSVCKKFAVTIQNSPSFFGFVDVASGLPVYMDYPNANTEIFLASAWGAKPPTRYVKPEDGSPTGSH